MNHFENTSDQPSKVISALYDAAVSLPLPHEEPVPKTALQPTFEEATTVYVPTGSLGCPTEFTTNADFKWGCGFVGHCTPGSTKFYATSDGRSSEENAPFFNVHKDGKGYIFAIGWTGQWNCYLERTPDNIIIKTKIEDTRFFLLPGEKIRTSSFVLMPYEGTVIESQNLWRRLLKNHFSIIGQKGRDAVGPLSAGFWGGIKSSYILESIEAFKKNNLPIEYLWIDAGWFGENTTPSLDDFESNWYNQAGDWQVSRHVHPGGLKDVSAKAHEAGMKFLLWYEIERAHPNTPIVKAHPEYFINIQDDWCRLLNLGDDTAWKYCFDTLSEMIEEIGIDCYRQDFNMQPLQYWRKNDEENRQGISEIKYINGLYRLWDALLEKFPHLLIDNCATGGRRIDVETLRRSITLWRSDYQCATNYPVEGTQCHHLSYNTWLPYSGTCIGPAYDIYRARSSYCAALQTRYPLIDGKPFGNNTEPFRFIKEMLQEYLKVRPFMSEDFYPLTEVSDRRDIWCAAQFDRPENNDGILQIFRRDHSPYETALFMLHNIDAASDYIFVDADEKCEQIISGKQLCENGIRITLNEKQSSKLYFYKKR